MNSASAVIDRVGKKTGKTAVKKNASSKSTKGPANKGVRCDGAAKRMIVESALQSVGQGKTISGDELLARMERHPSK